MVNTNRSQGKVLFIQRRMTEYRVPFFEKLRDSLMSRNVSLSVVYGSPSPKELSKKDDMVLAWGTKVPCNYFEIGNIQLVFKRIHPSLIKDNDMIIIPHENRLLLNHSLLLRHCSPGTRIAFFGHGANFQAWQSNSYREKLKSWTARHADWWFAYSELSRQRVIKNGFPSDRITCVNNSVDISSLIEWKKSIMPDELYALREALGLRGDAVGVFIGSLYKEKRLQFLFQACDEIRQRLPFFEIVVIGDGPLHDQVRSFVKTRKWARSVGAKHGREKVLHMCLGEVLLNPGLVGLNILDSFALGIPIVTTDCGIHSPEIAYLESGKNGLMVPDRNASFVEGVCRLFEDREMREALSTTVQENADRYSLDRMVANFTQGIMQALQSEPLRGKT